MRSIPESLKSKMKSLAQTKANNADPKLETIISRHVVPIPSYKLWQTAKVANLTASRVSIAVERPDYRLGPTKIYTAGIDSGTAKIYSAIFDGANAPTAWALELTIADALDISLAFLGKFRPYKHRTEFYTTDEKPWIFWIDTSGNLYARYWNDETTTVNLGANTTSCAATMGINSVQNEWGYGLLVAWTTAAGAVFYAQYFDGVWSDGITITQAPANATEVTISRVADYRLIFLVKDSSGALTALFFRSIAHWMSNYEKLEVVAATAEAGMTDVTYTNAFGDERIELSAVDISDATKYSILEPEPLLAYNIDDGIGNYGRFVMVKFRDDVYDFDDQTGSFTIQGTTAPAYSCFGISRPAGYDKNWLLFEFQDFNNAVGDCTISYTPGTFSSGVTAATAFTETFTPTGLIPTEVDPPIVTSIENTGEVDPNA